MFYYHIQSRPGCVLVDPAALRAIGSIQGHPCRTIQGSAQYMSLMTVQALREVSICDEARPTTQAVLFKL